MSRIVCPCRIFRHWVFTDAVGKVSEVKGPGAVGATPILKVRRHRSQGTPFPKNSTDVYTSTSRLDCGPLP